MTGHGFYSMSRMTFSMVSLCLADKIRVDGRMERWREKGGKQERKKNSRRASTVPCGIQVLCGERVLDLCHKRAGQKTARKRRRVLLLITVVLTLKFVLLMVLH